MGPVKHEETAAAPAPVALPRNASGKVMKNDLRGRFAGPPPA
jgi:acyl-coenzyme A synthetase/AMP-(fatty) acid ligase